MAAVADLARPCTLGEYVGRLSEGSRCFCCGAAMRRAASRRAGFGTSKEGAGLFCPHCGVEVVDGATLPDSEDDEEAGSWTRMGLTAA